MDIILIIFKVMALIVGSILCLLLFLLLLIILLLLIPVKYDVVISKNLNIIGKIRASWFFGVLKFIYVIGDNKSFINLRLFWKDIVSKREPVTKTKNELNELNNDEQVINKKSIRYYDGDDEKERKENKGSNFSFIDILKHPNRNIIVAETIVLIKKLFKIISPKVFSINAEFGMDDPALTGWLIGILYVIKGVCDLDMSVKGDFTQKKLLFDLNAKGSLNLLFILWEIILYVFKKPIWILIKKNFL